MRIQAKEVAGLATLGLVQGILETAVMVQLTAVAFAAAGTHRLDALPVVGATAWSPLTMVGALTLTTIVAASVRWWSERTIAAVCTRAMVGVRARLFTAYCRAGWLTQSAERAGTLHEVFTSSAQVVGQSTQTVSAALVAGVQLSVVAVAAVAISPAAAIAVVLVGALVVGVAHPFRARTRRVAKAAAGANQQLATVVAETTLLNRDLRTNGVHDVVAQRARQPIERAARLAARVRLESRLVPATARDATIVGVAVGLVLVGEFSAVAVGATALLLLRAIGYAQQVSTAVQSLADRRVNLELLDAAVARYEQDAPGSGSDPDSDPGSGSGPGPGGRLDRVGTVRFAGVGFTYPGATSPALTGVDLVLAPGEVVGVVGRSGAGKSTLLHVLLGLIRPDEGRLTADGVDVSTVDLDDWLRRIAYVPQEPRLLTGSVADNVRFLRDGIDDDSVAAAVRDAGLAPDVAGWPDGLEHQVGPLGGALSGGQRQRVALARALAGRPELLVLDEPTSALDGRAEDAVLATIARLRGRTTVVIVAHRPSTVQACDRVYEMRDRRLAPVDHEVAVNVRPDCDSVTS